MYVPPGAKNRVSRGAGHSPLLGPTQSPGKPEMLQVCASPGDESGPWQLEEDLPGGDRDATGTVLHCRSSPVEISSEEREGLQKAHSEFASPWHAVPSSLGLFRERELPQTSSLTHGSRTGFKAASFLPTARAVWLGGVERLGSIK